jgi:hypothetical protein
MGKKKIITDYYVRVEPKRLGNFGIVSVPDRYVSNNILQDYYERCRDIVLQIKRHVDDIDWAGVINESEEICEFCESAWTEGDSIHNGGCCDKDIEIMDNLEKDKCKVL